MFLAGLTILGAVLAFASRPGAAQQPDITFVTFAPEHAKAYQDILPEFERRTGSRVRMLVVDGSAMGSRLRAALEAGAQVPDVVELNQFAPFTRGPVEDIGFTDLSERITRERIDQHLVTSRFSLWASRGHRFALPHDVHPVMLAYRKDVVERLGIQVEELTTWDKFTEVGRRIAQTRTPEGDIRHYMLDLPKDSSSGSFDILMQQADAYLFNEQGNVTFDSDLTVKIMSWYVKHARGKTQIGTAAGWGQALASNLKDERVLFVFTPDWRSHQFESNMPELSGQLRMIPLPAWKEGSRRTSYWGGTGIFITKASPKQELAWELAKFLYLDESTYGQRFLATYILPPVRSAWNLPELKQPIPYFGGQPIGQLYAALAPDVPAAIISTYDELAHTQASGALLEVGAWYEQTNDAAQLEAKVREALTTRANYVRATMSRNRFLTSGTEAR